MNISALANVLCREMAQNSSINKPPAGFSSGASDLCTYKKQNDSDICLKNQKSIFRIVQNDIATVEHKDRSSYKME